MLRNLTIMKYYLSLCLPFMLGPILHVFYDSRGLDVSHYYILFAVGLASVFIFELPTGVVADKLGYKYSLVVGSLMVLLSIVGLIFANNLITFIIAEIIFGLGAAFISGADSGLIYDTLLVLGREEEYSEIYSKTRQFIFVAAGLGSLVSSMIYTISSTLPFILNAVFVGSTIVLAMFIKEPMHVKKDIVYKQQLRTVRKHIFSNKKIWAIILLSSIVFTFYRPSINLYRPFFKAVELDVFYYGIIFFGLNIVALLSSKHSKLYYKLSNGYPLMGLILTMLVTFILISVPILFVGLLGMGVNQIVRGLFKPVVSTYINNLTESDIRATTLSYVSLINNIAAGVGALLFSLFVDDYTVFKFVLILAGMLIVLTFFTYSFVNRRYGIK